MNKTKNQINENDNQTHPNAYKMDPMHTNLGGGAAKPPRSPYVGTYLVYVVCILMVLIMMLIYVIFILIYLIYYLIIVQCVLIL